MPSGIAHDDDAVVRGARARSRGSGSPDARRHRAAAARRGDERRLAAPADREVADADDRACAQPRAA